MCLETIAYYENDRLPILRLVLAKYESGLLQTGFRFAAGSFHDTTGEDKESLKREIASCEAFVRFCKTLH